MTTINPCNDCNYTTETFCITSLFLALYAEEILALLEISGSFRTHMKTLFGKMGIEAENVFQLKTPHDFKADAIDKAELTPI
jgi:hypothetical protein